MKITSLRRRDRVRVQRRLSVRARVPVVVRCFPLALRATEIERPHFEVAAPATAAAATKINNQN